MSAQSCPTFFNPMDSSLSGSSVHGIFQARILEWVAIFFSRGFSQPRDRTFISCVSCFGRQILYRWATSEDVWEIGCYTKNDKAILNNKAILKNIWKNHKDFKGRRSSFQLTSIMSGKTHTDLSWPWGVEKSPLGKNREAVRARSKKSRQEGINEVKLIGNEAWLILIMLSGPDTFT